MTEGMPVAPRGAAAGPVAACWPCLGAGAGAGSGSGTAETLRLPVDTTRANSGAAGFSCLGERRPSSVPGRGNMGSPVCWCISCCCGGWCAWWCPSGCQGAGMLLRWWEGGGMSGLQQEACELQAGWLTEGSDMHACMHASPCRPALLETLHVAAPACLNGAGGPWPAGWPGACQGGQGQSGGSRWAGICGTAGCRGKEARLVVTGTARVQRMAHCSTSIRASKRRSAPHGRGWGPHTAAAW